MDHARYAGIRESPFFHKAGNVFLGVNLCGHSCWNYCHPVLLTSSRDGDSDVLASFRCPAGICQAQTSNDQSAPYRGLQRIFHFSSAIPLSMPWMPRNQLHYCWIQIVSLCIYNFSSQEHGQSGFHFQYQYQRLKFCSNECSFCVLCIIIHFGYLSVL